MKGGGYLSCSKRELVIKQLSLFLSGVFILKCCMRFSLNLSTGNLL